MINSDQARQNTSKNHKKRRTQAEKVGRRKWIVRTLNRLEEGQKRNERRLRMLMAGLRGLLIIEGDYISMVACRNKKDLMLLNALREAGSAGRQTAELAPLLGINYRRVNEVIDRMNRRMDQELGEHIIEKDGHKWKLIAKVRRDFAAEETDH